MNKLYQRTFLAGGFPFPVVLLSILFFDFLRFPDEWFLLESVALVLPDEDEILLSNWSINLPSKIFSSGSHVEYFGPHPFHFTKYSAIEKKTKLHWIMVSNNHDKKF